MARARAARYGRAPKPTALKRLQGNPGGKRLNDNEPMPERGDVKPPRWLSVPARREWRRVAGVLYDAGLLTVADHDALALYCEAMVTYRQAMARVRVDGEILESHTGSYYQHPALGVANRARAAMVPILREFGMTPASRSGLHVTQAPEEPTLAETLFQMVNEELES